MSGVLSIQSHVTFGYVGNRAAVFPLQCLGIDVAALNTVQFSNHTGYGQWRGDIFTRSHIADLYQGLKDLHVESQFSALLTGYMGSPEIGAVISEIVSDLKAQNKQFVYCCDPVIGDVGRGIFVKPGVGEYFREHLVQEATILTPNQFELGYLTGKTIEKLDDVLAACKILVEQGIKTVLVTSVATDDLPQDKIGLLLYTSEFCYLVTTPRLDFKVPPNGAGDATAALFLGHTLQESEPTQALAKTAEALYQLFLLTHQQNSRELRLIQSRKHFDTEMQSNCELKKIL